jgi:hypothetical protein
VQVAGQALALLGDGLLPLALAQGFLGLDALVHLPLQFGRAHLNLSFELATAHLQAPHP